MPFLGHNPYDGLDVSPDNTPVDDRETDATTLARQTVQRFSIGPDDERMLLDLLGLLDPADVGDTDDVVVVAGATIDAPADDADRPRETAMSG